MNAPDNTTGPIHLPLMEDSLDHPEQEVKPTWRGWVHLTALPVAIAAGIVLIVLADGVAATLSSAVFVTSSILMFGISGTYHRFHWSPTTKIVLKRLDHTNIFLLIAGTYTPIAVLALPPDKAQTLLVAIGIGTVIGIAMRVFWVSAPRWSYVPIYLGLGWAAVMYLPDLLAANQAMMILVLAGGVAYTVGGVIYGLKRPNPSPATFGFHEIFHALTVVAFLCHWGAVLLIAMNPPLG